MQDGDEQDLQLFLQAAQQGLLNAAQLRECLQEWEERQGSAPGDPSPFQILKVAVQKGFLSADRLEQLSSPPSSDDALTERRIDITMTCGRCRAERVLTLEAAIRSPRCAGCSGPLHFRAPADTGSRGPRRSVPDEVRQAQLDPRNLFSKYVLLSKLGTGGMGEVWRAWDTLLYRLVALKFPRNTGEEEIHRLHLEAQGAGSLSHPNVASIYEIAEADGRHYIAMQYISGRTAEEAVKERKPDPREVVRWVRDAARGVHYAHESGVIHRDLKPANVMIDAEGRIFVMDFGLAKLTSGEGSATVSGVILGTPAFMPPEQAAANAGQVDRRSDVYALGAMLYVLLSGRRPYDGESATDILVQILTTEPLALKKVWPEAPWELEAVVARAMARARDQRYDTAKEFADDLDRYLANEPIRARRQSALLLLTRKLRRRTVPLASIGAGLLLLVVGIGFYVRSTRVPPPLPAGPDRLQAWAEMFPRLQKAIASDSFDPAAASALLERLDRDFPEQKGSVALLIESEYRDVARLLAGMPRSRWLELAPQVRRCRDWLRYMKKPADAADRILAYRGTVSLTIQVTPYAEIRSPLLEGLPAEERVTPLFVRDVEIRDGGLELVHPKLGAYQVPLPDLKNGARLVIEGSLRDPKTIHISEGP